MSPDRIVLTASTSEAYSLLFKLLADAGDEVLVPRPELSAVRSPDAARSGRAAALRSRVSRRLVDRLRQRRAGDHAAHARGAGRQPEQPDRIVRRADELDRLAAICAPRDIAIIADEVFADYELEPGAASRAGRVATRRDVLSFALGGLSKSVGLPQVKLGWIAVGGPGLAGVGRARAARARVRHLSVGVDAGAAGGGRAARARRTRSGADRGARVPRELSRLRSAAPASPACRVLPAEGGWYAVLQVPSLQPEEDLVVDLRVPDGVLAHPGYFFDFPRESFLVVSLLPPEASFADGVSRVLRHFDGTRRHERPVPAAAARVCSSRSFPAPSSSELGHRRHRRHRAGHRVAGRRRPARPAAAAAQRDGAGPAVAVFRDQRDGDRSDLHPRPGRARVRGARRRGVARRAAIGTASTAVRRAPRIDYAAVRPLKNGVAPRARSSVFSRPSGIATPSAHARSGDCQRAGVVARGLRAVSRAPRPRGRAAVDDMAGRAAAPRAGGDRSRAPRAGARGALPPVPAVARRHAVAGAPAPTRTASRSSATCRSWWTATAPTSGRASISSGSTRRSARRPTRSARPARTGACRSIGGTRWPPRISAGCASARRSADLFDGYRVDHLVGFYRTYGRPRDGGAAVLHAGGRGGADRARRAAARHFPTPRGRDHRRGSRHRARLRARVARAAGRPRLPRVPLGAPLARRRGSRSAIPRTTRRSRSRRRARTTPSRWPSGGSTRRPTSGRKVAVAADHSAADGRRRSDAPGVRRDRPRRAARGAVRVGLGSAAAARAGRLRLARSHQRAGDRHRRQLDVPPAVARRSAGRDP